jgi:hypothetical protein
MGDFNVTPPVTPSLIAVILLLFTSVNRDPESFMNTDELNAVHLSRPVYVKVLVIQIFFRKV